MTVFTQDCEAMTVFQATNEVVTRVPKSTQGEMQAATDAASEAFKTWSKSTVLTRQQLMFNLQSLIKRDMVNCCLKI